MFEGAVGRSEWSAKRERSEREADHERRRVLWECVSDHGVDEHRVIVR